VSWAWFDFCAEHARSCLASAQAWSVDGRCGGFLMAWSAEQDQPTPTAAKIDTRAIDAAGAGGWVSLVIGPAGMSLPFDDPAVVHASRMILAMAPADVSRPWSRATTAVEERSPPCTASRVDWGTTPSRTCSLPWSCG